MHEINRIEFKQELTDGFEKELVEHLGSGVPRILENYSKDCFKFSNNFIRMSFPFTFPLIKKEENDDKIGGAINKEKGGAIGGAIANKKGGAIKKTTIKQSVVLQIIKENNKISYREIAEKLNINESATLKHIDALKKKGYIERIGGTRGSWKIKI